MTARVYRPALVNNERLINIYFIFIHIQSFREMLTSISDLCFTPNI